ncbi:hypothetical protein N7493_000516 [Penicillium malachiteum]|uniref:Uncharacterized protein n=1 Tax=Penicillium malachiteum TaxID=1324776 RepID=A0AAD6HWF8_9EURO|nr:hypothetical protein N7493_000516 [Penicillium malachiteum]
MSKAIALVDAGNLLMWQIQDELRMCRVDTDDVSVNGDFLLSIKCKLSLRLEEYTFACSEDGDKVIVGAYMQVFDVHSIKAGQIKPIKSLQDAFLEPKLLQLSPDKRWVVSSDLDVIQLWDLNENGAVVPLLQLTDQSGCFSLAFSADSRQLACGF